MSRELSASQQMVFARLITALDKRHDRMYLDLKAALDVLYVILGTVDENDPDPRWTALDQVLCKLSAAASETLFLQDDVHSVLYNQLVQSQSAKNAYDQGWRDQRYDILARATPDQWKILYDLLAILPDKPINPDDREDRDNAE